MRYAFIYNGINYVTVFSPHSPKSQSLENAIYETIRDIFLNLPDMVRILALIDLNKKTPHDIKRIFDIFESIQSDEFVFKTRYCGSLPYDSMPFEQWFAEFQKLKMKMKDILYK